MKRCPLCGSIYADDSLNYCLTDGTGLMLSQDGDDTPTIVRDQSSAPETHINPQGSGVSPVFKYLTVALAVFILLLGAAGFTAWSLWTRVAPVDKTTDANLQTPTIPSRTSDVGAPRNAIAEPTPPISANTQRTSVSTPSPESQIKDPGTTRINFRKGSVSETLKGIVAEKRSFVLRTMQGQQLVASVDSPSHCVSVEGGGDSLITQTPTGDVSLTLHNDCDRPSPFTLRITVR